MLKPILFFEVITISLLKPSLSYKLISKSPEEISRIADRYNQKAFGGNLEEDPHLSEN